ncbi:hypothetical protein A2U01_0091353, partial [Trifolium medium]|nr:hypothetical protein [Trifolium medium]
MLYGREALLGIDRDEELAESL